MGEHRRSTRQKSFLRGRVYFNNGRTALDCLIRDISSEGARIIFSDAVSVPDMLDLYLPQKDQTIRSRVRWRHGDEIGLSFPDAIHRADNNPAIDDLVARVARLESEIVAMRRLIKRLETEIKAGADAV
jgi:hypothetical protein